MSLRCGVIGVGHLGQHHADKYACIDKVDLIGVCDRNGTRAEEIAAKLGAKPYTDCHALLKECDAVSIAADTNQHYAITRDALESGVHVLVEKPITQTTDEARELIELAKSKKLVLQVGHLERFNPAIIKLTELVTQPAFINCQRISTFVQRTGLTGSDVIIDLMIHDIDLICYLMKDSAPTNIDAIGGQLFTNEIDICDARLVFSDGRTATLTTSRIGRRVNRVVKVFEFGACYIADLQAKTLQHIERDGDATDAYQLKTTEAFCDNSKDSLLLEIESFVDSVRNNTPALVSGEDGLHALELATRIRHSAKSTERLWHVHSQHNGWHQASA